MIFTKLLLENARAIRPCYCEPVLEPLLPKVARCIPVLLSRHIGKCAARVLKRSARTHPALNPIQAGVFWNHRGWRGAQCFSFICCPIITKLGMMVLKDKISQKTMKILLTSSPGGKYDVIKPSLVSSQVKFEFSYLLSNGAEIWDRGQF